MYEWGNWIVLKLTHQPHGLVPGKEKTPTNFEELPGGTEIERSHVQNAGECTQTQKFNLYGDLEYLTFHKTLICPVSAKYSPY